MNPRTDHIDGDKPWVSVIIPCLNDAGSLGFVLEALARQTYPRDRIEILVIDNGSGDGSPAIAKQHGVRLLHEPLRSAYRSRNRGIEASRRGKYLLFLDADTVPCPDWAANLVAAAEETGSPLAGGGIVSEVTQDTLGSMLLALTRSARHRQAGVEQSGRLSGGNMLVARSLFDRHGLFLPVQSGGDGEFSERANPERNPIPYVANAVVTHRCDITTGAYLRRAFRIAKGQAQARGSQPVRRLAWPWRPGVRRARSLCREILQRWGRRSGSCLFLRLFLVLWAERWMFFFGDRAGRTQPVGEAT